MEQSDQSSVKFSFDCNGIPLLFFPFVKSVVFAKLELSMVPTHYFFFFYVRRFPRSPDVLVIDGDDQTPTLFAA